MPKVQQGDNSRQLKWHQAHKNFYGRHPDYYSPKHRLGPTLQPNPEAYNANRFFALLRTVRPPDAGPVSNVDCRHHRFPLTPLPMPKKTFPALVPPMMAESTKAPFDSPDWIFEIKLDGYRAITVFDSAGTPHLWSRNGLPLEAKFPAVATAVSKLKLRSTILDGEVVAVDENGIPRFQLLQRFQKQPTAPTLYYVFDVLWCNGDDLTGNPILERRSVLERILKPAAGIQLGSYVEAKGKALFNLTKEKGMEGIIAKRKDSIYRPGKRTSDWLKIKARLQQEFVVGGFTAPKGSRKHLGAVLLGALHQYPTWPAGRRFAAARWLDALVARFIS
jgi:bifunctional non-homologous end joining protein LigD